MTDVIRDDWLLKQYEEAMAFAQRSPVVSLIPMQGMPPFRYLAKFECDGLVTTSAGIEVCDRHLVGIQFPKKYQHERCHPTEVFTWIEPKTAYHPNVRSPFCCVGDMPPGMSLLNLLQQLYQMISWQRFKPIEHDALNPDACRWAREHMDRLPIDPRRSMLHERPAGEATG